MAADFAEELRKYGVTAISLWPGAVRTELMTNVFKAGTMTVERGKTTFSQVCIKA